MTVLTSSFFSSSLTHFLKVLKIHDLQVVIIHQKGLPWHGLGRESFLAHKDVDDYSGAISFGASRLSIQMKSYSIHLIVPVSKAQQSS